jgi:hypothetical protein
VQLKLIAAALLFGLAACVATAPPAAPDALPRGFTQSGSPFPYNSPGW